MLTKVISADTIDGAVDKVLDELKEDARSGDRHNVIYFDGWDGLGASAVLRAVSRRLTPEPGRRARAAAGLEFSHIFHIDCSKWESRRAMQRMIAEQLKLPTSVMDMFDIQDDEDDYKGVAKGSRSEIPRVAYVINQQIQELNLRFLLIFHNGSSEEVDLSSFGFPLFDRYSRRKVLWSFQGRFRAYPRTKVDGALKNTRTTDVFISADSRDIGEDKFFDILRREAEEEVAHEMVNVNAGGIDWPVVAAKCFLYTVELYRMGNDFTDYDLTTHVCNYWRCGGIIKLQQGDILTDDVVDKLWASSDALHREMRLDDDYYKNPYFSFSVKRHLLKHMAYWTSPTCGFMWIPDGHIPRGMFQQFNKLCVLKLSACEFSFTSPPFFCCHNLRFLWLDHCQEGSSTAEVAEEDARQFLQRLWVLDVRYSNGAFLFKEMLGFMTLLRELNITGEEVGFDVHGRQLCNIRKLRIAKSDVPDEETTISGMNKLELLEFSENTSVSVLSIESCNNLVSVIIYGSTELKLILFTGCAKLKNLYLSGSFPSLEGIGIAGGVVEILDLRGVTAPDLDGLALLECEKLCAILWPSSANGKTKILSNLIIDTKQKEDITADTSTPPSGPDYWKIVGEKVKFNWHISIRDARILWSLEPVKDYLGSNDAHLEVSTILPPTLPSFDTTGTKDGRMRSSGQQNVQVELKQTHKDIATYADVVVTLKEIGTRQQKEDANEGDSSGATGIMWPCPPSPNMPDEDCYIHIEDPTNRTKSQIPSITLPGFICDGAKIMHVHDSLHITSIVAAPIALVAWNKLEWCRVERCPKLGCIFSPQLGGPEGSNNHTDMFKKLSTTWVSHLPKARYIWKWSGTSETWFRGETFKDLTLLHIDYCPRMIHIISYHLVRDAFDRLATLEIMWCYDLGVAFKYYDTPNSSGWAFLKLKQLRLHELPKLQDICNIDPWIYMPELKTVKIRGCWSLKRLPTVKSQNVVECDCEKEWWDRLEWESVEHRRRYKPIHPRYYKKTMLRGSVLR